jgi:hypothetical protein
MRVVRGVARAPGVDVTGGKEPKVFDADDMLARDEAQAASAAWAERLGEVLGARLSSLPGDQPHAVNANQIASKQWLLDKLHTTGGSRFGTVFILGGWCGVLGAMLFADRRFETGRVLSFDIDPGCEAVADGINRPDVEAGRFKAVTADVCALDYRDFDGAAVNGQAAPGLVINTSCEHMDSTQAWYERVPAGLLQVHQSNDYFDCPGHVNCVPDLAAFKAQVPMSELYFEGALPRRKYTRFMLIGRK